MRHKDVSQAGGGMSSAYFVSGYKYYTERKGLPLLIGQMGGGMSWLAKVQELVMTVY